jgi:hypothetical protein
MQTKYGGKKKKLKKSRNFFYLYWMKLKLMLFQAPPPIEKNGEGMLINIEGKATRREGK